MFPFQRDGDHTLIFRANQELAAAGQHRSGKNSVSQGAGKTSAFEHCDAEHGTNECCVA
jgi:hypothetical protein